MEKQILYLCPNAIPLVDFTLRDDGDGVFISAWNTAKLGAMPSVEAITQTIVPAIIPSEITMQQARQILLQTNNLAIVDAAIAGMVGASGDATRITWQYSNTLKRNHPLVASMAILLGLTSTEIDSMFIQASLI